MKKLINFILIGIIFCFFGSTSGVYVGEKLDGKHHGKGTMTYSDGAKYEGDWKHGKRHEIITTRNCSDGSKEPLFSTCSREMETE